MQSYGLAVAEYFRRPVRDLGTDIAGTAGSVQQGALICFGADLRQGILHKVGFRAFACPHIISACNWLAEQLEGMPAEALSNVDVDDLRQKFDMPVEKAGKLLILNDAIQACYADFRAVSASGK